MKGESRGQGRQSRAANPEASRGQTSDLSEEKGLGKAAARQEVSNAGTLSKSGFFFVQTFLLHSYGNVLRVYVWITCTHACRGRRRALDPLGNGVSVLWVLGIEPGTSGQCPQLLSPLSSPRVCLSQDARFLDSFLTVLRGWFKVKSKNVLWQVETTCMRATSL